jgi:hypothetical protein
MMRIGVPVECQHKHAATWVIEIQGFDIRHVGVCKEETCQCPKGELGEGWMPIGEPFILWTPTGEPFIISGPPSPTPGQ